METNVKFSSDAELDSFVVKLAQKCGRQISIANPLIDTTFPDGSRVQLTFGREITPRGSSFSIRKFRKDPYTPPDLIELNTLSAEMAAYLWLAVEHRKSIIFCGGAGCGKTTTMNAISLFIPPPVKIVSIEEVREINIPHKNWIASVTRSRLGGTQVSTELEIDMFDLLKSSLRQRPQYIILGEIRGVEAFTLFQAMATGTTTFSTIHADSVDSIVRRLTAPPINLPSVLFLSLNLVVLQTQTKILGKTVRLIKNIEEIAGIDDETKQVIVNDVYSYSGSTKNFEYSGKSLILDSICAHSNISGYELNEELKRRTEVIELLCKKKIRSYVDAGRIIASYYKSPEDTVAYLRRV
jgi:flagellar protein FlaI